MTELSVCIGSACHLKGSYNVIQTFQQMIEEYRLGDDILTFNGAFCMKACDQPGVGVSFLGQTYHIQPEMARTFFKETVLPALG